jgi:acyl-CoA thioester hydrolase
MGIVHHASYLGYFEVGRTELMRELGYAYSQLEADGFHLAVVAASCRYLSPARYDDQLEVLTRLGDVRAVRISFDYRIEREGARLAEGETTLACLGPGGRPTRLPAAVLERISGTSTGSRP